MPSRRLAGFAFAASLAAGCAGQQPQQLIGFSSERAALTDCRAPIEAKRCAARKDDPACWDEVVAEYEALLDPPARKRYLIEAGCPSPTVEVWLPDAR